MKLILLLLTIFAFSPPKGANQIDITGVIFKEVANNLLKQGYAFEKVDSNSQTIKTEWKGGAGKNKWMKLRLYARIKDSTAIITGEWYNTTSIGGQFLGQEQTIENSTNRIENTYGNSKNCFTEMNTFAISFNKPVEYLKK